MQCAYSHGTPFSGKQENLSTDTDHEETMGISLTSALIRKSTYSARRKTRRAPTAVTTSVIGQHLIGVLTRHTSLLGLWLAVAVDWLCESVQCLFGALLIWSTARGSVSRSRLDRSRWLGHENDPFPFQELKCWLRMIVLKWHPPSNSLGVYVV